jgi:predicted ferric reductase
LGVLHWITAWVYYAQQNGGSLQVGLAQINLALSNEFGYVSLAGMLVILFSSLEVIRRRWYEAFYYTHYFFIVFYLFGALHSYEMANYCIAAVIIYFLDRFIRILWGALPMRTLKLNYKEGDIVQIVFEKNIIARWLKLFKVGQYVFLNFPTLSPLEWHPFSVSSGPDEKTLEVHIKGLGDHTKQIVSAAKVKASMWVRVDGPYGNLKLNYRRFPVFLLAAGGIGVTPVVGILKDIYRFGELDPMAKKRHKSLVEKVYFIWTVQNMQQFAWFSEEIKYFLEAAKKGNSLPDLEVHIFVTKGEVEGPHATADHGTFHKGRPDFEGIFAKLCNDFKEKAFITFTCGPRRLVNDCWDAVTDQQRQGAIIHFHHETFEF